MVASKMDWGRRGRKKTAPVNRIGAVSPAARSSPRMTPVRMPGKASFKTMRRMVCQRVRAERNTHSSKALRNRAQCLFGGTDNDRQGHDRQSKGCGENGCAKVQKTARTIPRPNSPYTTDGIPARLMIAIRMVRVSWVSDAYSAR